jgi:hypothetical protein
MKLWVFKVLGISIFENLSRLLRQNDIWVQAPWLGIENTIRGKLVAFFKPELWLVHVCPWLIYAPKVLQLCINQLVVWFVQVRVNN